MPAPLGRLDVVAKKTFYLAVSPEMFDVRVDFATYAARRAAMTPGELAAEELERKAVASSSVRAARRAWRHLRRPADPMSRAALRVHRPTLDPWGSGGSMPNRAVCAHCRDGGDCDDPTEWPCDTFAAIQAAHAEELHHPNDSDRGGV